MWHSPKVQIHKLTHCHPIRSNKLLNIYKNKELNPFKFIKHKENVQNTLYSPKSEDRFLHSKENGLLSQLLHEFISNGYLYALVGFNEKNKHLFLKSKENLILNLINYNSNDFSLLTINYNLLFILKRIQELMKHKRHLNYGLPLPFAQMCSLYFYTSTEAFNDLNDSLRKQNYNKWKYFDTILYQCHWYRVYPLWNLENTHCIVAFMESN